MDPIFYTQTITHSCGCIRRLLAGALLVCVLVSAVGAQETREDLSIGAVPIERSLLIYVAEAKGYFELVGLNVTIKDYEAGAHAIRDAAKGLIDAAACSDLVLVQHNMISKLPQMQILGCINSARDTKVIGRRDHGVAKIQDLAGKRIGLAFGTNSEFYISLLPILNDFSLAESLLVDFKPSELGPALVRGEVDAVMLWEPLISKLEQELGANAVSFPGQSGVLSNWVLVAQTEIIQKRQAAFEKLLKGLIMAEDFVNRNPEEAMAVAKKANIVPSDTASRTMEHKVVLDRLLILAMEDRARWVAAKNNIPPSDIPNVSKFLYPQILERIKPEAIRVIY